MAAVKTAPKAKSFLCQMVRVRWERETTSAAAAGRRQNQRVLFKHTKKAQ